MRLLGRMGEGRSLRIKDEDAVIALERYRRLLIRQILDVVFTLCNVFSDSRY